MILEIPFEAMMNEASLINSPSHNIIPEDEYLTATNIMALHLLYHKQNKDSKWREYIDYLPSSISTYVFVITNQKRFFY